MYELKKNGKVFTSKFVGTGPSSYEKRIYRAAVSQWLRNTGVEKDVRIFNETFYSEWNISYFGDVSLQITFTEVSYKNLYYIKGYTAGRLRRVLC